MKNLIFLPMETDVVRALQRGGPDANGRTPEKFISDGTGLPCRHCLANIKEGDEVLVLSHKPFQTKQPYAEQGPIFLHSDECMPYENVEKLPPMYAPEGQLLLRGYCKDERIIYGTGTITENPKISEVAEHLFKNPDVAFIHARSASNNCYQFKIIQSDLA